MSPTKTLILGGARSGKTARALSLCEPFPTRIYVATAQAGDDEMRAKIKAHQEERGANWTTLEVPHDLAAAIRSLNTSQDRTTPSDTVILVDCLTLWLSNVMLAERDVVTETDALLAALDTFQGAIVLVSNELGLGLVPDTPLGRKFRDAQGRLNQRVAATADVVEFIAAGLPMRLKP